MNVTFFNLQNKTNTFYCGVSVFLNPLIDNMKTCIECKYGISFIRDGASFCPVGCSVQKQSAISQSICTLFPLLDFTEFP